MNRKTEKTLRRLYNKFDGDEEIEVTSPEFERIDIKYLAENGLIETIDASSFDGWAYLVRKTYGGEYYFKAKYVDIRRRVFDWVKWLIPTIISVVALIVSIVK